MNIIVGGVAVLITIAAMAGSILEMPKRHRGMGIALAVLALLMLAYMCMHPPMSYGPPEPPR